MATYIWLGTTDGTWNTAGNWLPSGTPGAGDSVIFNGSSTGTMETGPTGAPLLATVWIDQSTPAGTYIGSPESPIAAGATTFIVGRPNTDGSDSSSGSQQICWNFGSAQTAVRIVESNTSGVDGREAVCFKGSHASNVLNLEGPCSVGAGTLSPSDTYTLAEVNVNDSGAALNLAAGGTLAKLNQLEGSIVLNAPATAIHQEGGTLRSEGTGAIGSVQVGGIAVFNSLGTITTLHAIDNGLADFSDSAISRIVTNATVHGTGRLTINNGKPLSVTFTNGIDLVDGASVAQLDLGREINLAITAA